MKTLKLISFFYFLISIFCLQNANAQIVYTDIADTTILVNSIPSGMSAIKTIDIDLNNDGIREVQFKASLSKAHLPTCAPTVMNSFASITTPVDSSYYTGDISGVSKLNNNMVIHNNSSWIHMYLTLKSLSHTYQYCAVMYSGYWSSGDGYVGIKFNVNNNTFYGWVRISVVAGTVASITIKDYAYNSIPNQSILAGETSCTIPTVTVAKSGSLSFCAGDSVTFTANGTGYLYQWKKNGVNIAGATSQTYVAKTAGGYKCRVTNSCGSATSTTKNVTISCRIIENLSNDPEPTTVISCNCSLPNYGCFPLQTYCQLACGSYCHTCNSQAVVTANDTLIFCNGDSVVLTASRSYGSATHYQWLKDSTVSAGDTAQTLTVKVSGYYQCMVTNSCNTKTSVINIVTVELTPTVNLSVNGSLSFCAGDSVTFTANGTGYQYQWKKNNVNIAGATLQTYAAKTAGVYKCKVTNGCGSKTSGTRTVTVPCRESNSAFIETLEHLSVYPNPATNSVTVKFPSDEGGEIQIVNLFGQIVFSEKINAEQKQIDVSRFSAGMYVVRWNSGENFETKTFSIVK